MRPMARVREKVLKVVGITGRTGSGKSTLAAHLAERFGCPLIGADELGHAALNEDPRIAGRGPGAVRFGRPRLRRQSRPEAPRLDRLQRSRGPIATSTPSFIRGSSRRSPPASPPCGSRGTLVSSSSTRRCSSTGPTGCRATGSSSFGAADETAIGRLAGRGIPEAEARRRLASQDSEDRFLRRADIVVANDGAERELEEQLPRIWESLNAEPKERNR